MAEMTSRECNAACGSDPIAAGCVCSSYWENYHWITNTSGCPLHSTAAFVPRYRPMTTGGLPDEAFWPDDDGYRPGGAMAESAHFQIGFTVEEWTALLRLVDDHVESLVDWDADTRSFYEEIANKLREGPLRG